MEAMTGQDLIGEILELAKKIVRLCEKDGQYKKAGGGETSESSVLKPHPKVIIGNH